MCPTKPVDAIDVICQKCECGKRAYYNFSGQKALFCAGCAQPGMTRNPTQRCESCRELALFGKVKRHRCEKHKEEDDINFVERRCSRCGLEEVLDASNICKNCNPVSFPKIQHRKELRIRDILLENDFLFVHDKVANGVVCGKERPDFVFYFDGHVVVLEVDEYQHAEYQCECEQIRMINVTQSFGGMPVLWIRYNPDAYHKDGNLIKVTTRQRETHLIQWLKWSRSYQPKHLGSVVYLFYDGCNTIMSKEDIQVLI